jgi:hypothetical protein
VESNGTRTKEAGSSAYETVDLNDNSKASSTAPVDPSAPMILTEANAFEYTAYNFSLNKKWAVLTVVALCQTSMSKHGVFTDWEDIADARQTTMPPYTPTLLSTSMRSTTLAITTSPTPEPEWPGS